MLASCQPQVDWVNYRGEAGSGRTRNALFTPLGLRWKLLLSESATIDPEKPRVFNPPIIRGETMFFGSNDSNFYALDASRGYMKWIFKTRGPVNSVPYADDKSVYFGSNDGSVYSVDQETGGQNWEFPTGNTVQSLVLRYEDTVIFTSDTGATFLLDPEGKEKNRLDNPVWSHHTFQVYRGIVYWAPLGRGFGAYDLAKQDFLWVLSVPSNYSVWYSFPALEDDYLYFASSEFKRSEVVFHYYAVNRMTGENVWQIDEEPKFGSKSPENLNALFMKNVNLLDYLAPSLYKNLIIYTSGDSVVRAYNKTDGKLAWTAEFDYPTSSAPTIAGDRIYFGLRGDESDKPGEDVPGGTPARLVCLSAADGKILWQMDTEGAVLNSPVVSGKRMIFGTEKNMFYVLEEIF